MRMSLFFLACFLLMPNAFSMVPTDKGVLADLTLLKKAGVTILHSNKEMGVGYSRVDEAQERLLSQVAHDMGRCGGYEVLPGTPQNREEITDQFENLLQVQRKHNNYGAITFRALTVSERPEISSALKMLDASQVKSWVAWLSSYPNRYNKAKDANKHIVPFMDKLKELTKSANFPVTIEQITHTSTPQNSVRVTVPGSTRPEEVIVLGGHLDSINMWGGKAPGADDNASGSSDLVEALRVLVTQAQPERTIEFYWYAGEESGLLGSAEIAKTAKSNGKNVIAVLQLDMTMFPGDGVFKISSMTDFTSPWLRDYLNAINKTYLKIEVQEDKCGYGCSDHASWFKQGYPTLMPSEALFDSMFSKLHTEQDVINPQMNFDHSLVFSKIALIMAMDLGNSLEHQPY